MLFNKGTQQKERIVVCLVGVINRSIKNTWFSIYNNIIKQLEEKYISLNRMGNIHLESLYDVSSDIKKSFKLEDLTARDVDYVYSIDFQNHFSLIRYIAGEKGKIYNAAIDKIDEITALIDQELNSKV